MKCFGRGLCVEYFVWKAHCLDFKGKLVRSSASGRMSQFCQRCSMKLSFRNQMVAFSFGMLCFLFCLSTAKAQHCFLCRKAAVDMPVSLAIGTVRTSAFTVKHAVYEISIRVEKRIPLGELECRMSVKKRPDHCEMYHFERQMEADWIVLDGNRVVARGALHSVDDNVDYSDKYLSRLLGTFEGESKKSYVLEIKFTKDGTLLNVTNPHLIVMMTKATDI